MAVNISNSLDSSSTVINYLPVFYAFCVMPLIYRSQVVQMAERLCCGRVVSVLERRCQTAQADVRAQADDATAAAATPTPTTTTTMAEAPGATTPTATPLAAAAAAARPGPTAKAEAEPPAVATTSITSGNGKHKLEPSAGVGQEGYGQGVRGEADKTLGLCSELDCLKGHIRGLCSTTVQDTSY